MSVVSFNYWEIEDSIKKANKTASYLSDYINDMNSVLSSCNSLEGSDSCGYVDHAVELINKKIKQARNTKNVYTNFSKDLDALERTAQEKDRAVEKNINVTVSDYVGKRSWGQAIGDWIYNRYVGFLDCVSALPLVGDCIAQGIRTAGNWVSDMSGRAYNYFKYGDGKYIWNGAKAVAGALVAVVGVVTAAIAVGAAAVPALVAVAVVGFIAASVYAVLKFGDMMASVEQNMKAWKLAKQYRESVADKYPEEEDEEPDRNWWDTEKDQGSITAARYYGSITGVKDWIDKTDFGGKWANQFAGDFGDLYSTTERAMAIVSSVCQITVGLGNAQYVKGADGQWVTYKSGDVVKKNGSFFQNLKTTYLEKAGITYKRTPVFNKYSLKNGKLQIDWKNSNIFESFKVNFFEGYTNTFSKAGITGKPTLWIYSGAKLFKNTDGFVSNVETLHEWDRGKTSGFEDANENAKAALDIVKIFEGGDAFLGDFTDVGGVIGDLYEGIKEFISPTKNAYEMYLEPHRTNSTGSSGRGYSGAGLPG